MNPQETKIVFFGTPKFAAEILQTLIESKYNISAVFTQPDKKFGRSQEMKKSAAKEVAEKKSIPVFEPQNFFVFQKTADIGINRSIFKPKLFSKLKNGIFTEIRQKFKLFY